MKSYVTFLQGLYGAMLSDIAVVFPSDRKSLDRDSSRLLSLVKQRGLPFLVNDLPAMGKHLDRCLANERLTLSGVPGFRGYRNGSTIPRLFKGMWLRVFDEFGLLRVDADKHAIRSLRQLLYAAKKLKIACPTHKTWEQVHEYFQIDGEIRPPTLNWDEDEFRIDGLRNLHLGDSDLLSPAPLFDGILADARSEGSSPDRATFDVVQRTADIVAASLGRFNPSEWRTKHGPGAVADQRRTQFKYDFPNWPAKLDHIFPMSELAFANYQAWVDMISSDGPSLLFSENEPPARMISVPKTYRGPRLIAAEPTAHQWCQQSILDFLATRVSETPIGPSIRFRDQGPNQVLALEASHSQSHATIDLSSASDRLSCWTVERVFRANGSLLQALHASRTRWIVNTIDRNSPKFHKLRKFASMGSACTFPVQTYVFCILACAAVLVSRNVAPTIRSITRVAREVRVFGDDIIIPTDGVDHLLGIFGHLGLKVNSAKTFVSGKFRESCGLDAWDGFDVTPTYTMTYPDVSRPESVVSVVGTHNNFVSRGYFGTADYIKSRSRHRSLSEIAAVPTGSGLFGWYDHEWRGHGLRKRRYNPTNFQVEVRALSVYTKSTRQPVLGKSQVLQYFTEVRPVDYILGDRIGVLEIPRVKLRPRWVPEGNLDILQIPLEVKVA